MKQQLKSVLGRLVSCFTTVRRTVTAETDPSMMTLIVMMMMIKDWLR